MLSLGLCEEESSSVELTCSKNCFGIKGYHGSCCRLEDRDFIIGPIHDPKEFLERLNRHFNRQFSWSDVFIDYEEGSKMFPNKSTWQNTTAYPALKIDLDSYDKRCIFYNNHLRACSVYEIRSVTCSRFQCDHLKSVLKSNEVKG
jgi:Fe-S-cluster containining protein